MTTDQIESLYAVLFKQEKLDSNLLGILDNLEKLLFARLTIEELTALQKKV